MRSMDYIMHFHNVIEYESNLSELYLFGINKGLVCFLLCFVSQVKFYLNQNRLSGLAHVPRRVREDTTLLVM